MTPSRVGPAPDRLNRRSFLHRGIMAAAAFSAGCMGSPAQPAVEGAFRLSTRPRTPTRNLGPGVHDLAAAGGTAGSLFIPDSYRAEEPAPLFIMLHGAGPSREQMHLFFPRAEPYGVAMLTPRSSGPRWDMLLGAFGPDVAALDQALAFAFDNCAIDPTRVTLGGFSDGGSYALSLGLANGDLLSRLVGFSPGFLTPPRRIGKPAIFLAHGTRDEVLPIDGTSRVIREQLSDWAYDVTYREFDGPHTVTHDLALEAFAWMTGRP
jgi:phospholipase/carboxylesterase